MQNQPEELIRHFKPGDAVRIKGKSQVLRITECKVGLPHVYIEFVRTVRYKCEWRHPNGEIYSEWQEGSNLEFA